MSGLLLAAFVKVRKYRFIIKAHFWCFLGASGYDVTFIHPKGNNDCPIGGEGVLIELVQAPKDVIDVLTEE